MQFKKNKISSAIRGAIYPHKSNSEDHKIEDIKSMLHHRPIRAAIYARKSNSEDHKDEDNKSVQRQIERGKQFAIQHGWEVSDSNIFIDDGYSGADFSKREGLKRLRGSIKEYDVIIVSEISRFGRSGDRTQAELLYYIEHDIEIYCYLTNERVEADTEEQRLMLRLKTFSAAIERERCSLRVYDTLSRKFDKGHAVGGRCFGYKNVPVMGINRYDEEVRAYVESHVKEDEAKVVRGIFAAYLDGYGFHSIAKMMNGDSHYQNQIDRFFNGTVPKKPVRAGMWQAPLVRQMLNNPRYSGRITYGARKNVFINGEKKQKRRDSFLIMQREDLRIIEEGTWQATQSRLGERRADYLAAVERNPQRSLIHVSKEQQSTSLLSRLCECSECGQPFRNVGGNTGSGENRKPMRRYACKGYSEGGDEYCSNSARVLTESLDKAVLTAIQQQVLSGEAINYIISRAHELLSEQTLIDPDRAIALTENISQCDREAGRLTKAIQFGTEAGVKDSLGTLVTSLAKVSSEKEALVAELARIQANRDAGRLDDSKLRVVLSEKMNNFTELMLKDVHRARTALQHLLTSRIRLTPTMREGRKGLTFKGETCVGGLFSDPEDESCNYTRVHFPW